MSPWRQPPFGVRCLVRRAWRSDAPCRAQAEPVSRERPAGKHGPEGSRLARASASRAPNHPRTSAQPLGQASLGLRERCHPHGVLVAGTSGARRPPPSSLPLPPTLFDVKSWEDGREPSAASAYCAPRWGGARYGHRHPVPGEGRCPSLLRLRHARRRRRRHVCGGKGAPQQTPASRPALPSCHVCQGLKTEFTFTITDVIYCP